MGQNNRSKLMSLTQYTGTKVKISKTQYSKTLFKIAFMLILIPALFFQCSEDSIPTADPLYYEIAEVSMPAVIYAGSDYYVEIIITIITSDDESNLVIKAEGLLAETSSQSSIDLYDDGLEGDNAPGDRVIRKLINSNTFSDIAGSKSAVFTIINLSDSSHPTTPPSVGEPVPVNYEVVDGMKNTPPVIEEIIMPTEVDKENSDFTKVELFVTDANGYDDIKTVEAELYLPYSTAPALTIRFNDDGLDGDLVQGDSLFTVLINHFALTSIGEYALLFKAFDNSNTISETPYFSTFNVLGDTTNYAPEMVVSIPDSIQAGTGPVSFYATVSDPNGQDDIAMVYYNSFAPDGTPSSSNPNIMHDDGDMAGFGDVTANDGIYSFTINIPAGFSGEVTFEFHAVDRRGLEAVVVTKTVEVY